jgi:hypothetical protein
MASRKMSAREITRIEREQGYTLKNPLVRAYCELSEAEGGATGDWLFWMREHLKEKLGLEFKTNAELMFWYETHDAQPHHLEKFRQICRDYLAAGVNPTPGVMERHGYAYPRKYLGGPIEFLGKKQYVSSGPCFKSGRYTKARRQELVLAGWTLNHKNGRWNPPKEVK